MDKLVSYVSAILGQPSPVSIRQCSVRHESWHDQGVEVQREEALYVFDNGAVVRRATERDRAPDAGLACAEEWIDYEVVEHPPRHPVQPRRQGFDNACREAFWLRYHSA